MFLASITLLLAAAMSSALAKSVVPWKFAGPASSRTYGSKSLAFNYNSAAHVVLKAGPKNEWTFVATVNGGIWRTKNLYEKPHPVWECVTDKQPVTCSSMSALAASAQDPNFIIAGCGGSTSGEVGSDWNTFICGDWSGLMASKDGGDSWAMMDAFPKQYSITDVAAFGESVLVSARSNFFNRSDGGVWLSEDSGKSFARVLDTPVTDLDVLYSAKGHVSAVYAASVYDKAGVSVYSSLDGGKTFKPFSHGIEWRGQIPYYTQMSISTANDPPVLFLAGYSAPKSYVKFAHGPDLTGTKPATEDRHGASSEDRATTQSAVFMTELGSHHGCHWKVVPGKPLDLDQDHMPKDKIAVLADPELKDVIYIAGNADGYGNCQQDDCTLVFRINWRTGSWEYMGAKHETVDGEQPHPDCRNLAWDKSTGNLMLTTDGGLFVRTHPRQKGTGIWYGAQGDTRAMELLFANWDSRLSRYISGAQDNDVQITPPRDAPDFLTAAGFLGCDGTRTGIDNVHCPARMFGSCQFLDGLTMFYATNGSDAKSPLLTTVALNVTESIFTNPYNFPFFVPAWSLNAQNPQELVLWVNGTGTTKTGLYRLSLPDDTQELRLAPPKHALLAAVDGFIFDIEAGGRKDGKLSTEVITAVNNTHIITLDAKNMSVHPLPSKFAVPVHLHGVKNGDWALGPLGHGSTVFVSVSPADRNHVAVTGWPEDYNRGKEGVWYSTNAGRTWMDIMGDLKSASGTIARARPNGVLIVEFEEHKFDCVLVGTVNGVFVTFTDEASIGRWTRLGSLRDFPRVLNYGLSYEPYSDTLLAATYGRGVYVLHNARELLYSHHHQRLGKDSTHQAAVDLLPASRFFPKQEVCV